MITFNSRTELLKEYSIRAMDGFTARQKNLFQKYNFAPVIDANGDLYFITHEQNILQKIRKNKSTQDLKDFKALVPSIDRMVSIPETIYYSLITNTSNLKQEYTVDDGQTLFMDILADASRKGASDIHVSWERESVELKYRIDGRIEKQNKNISIPLGEIFKNICINRIGADEYEKNEIAGQFETLVNGKSREYRVSIGPTVHGFSIVIRVASSIAKNTTLKTWNYSDKAIGIIEKMKDLKHGIVLVTGPTGSGKSTLLYTIANEISQRGDKIIKTVEDPVEIVIDGIDQVQVNVKGEKENWMTFAKAIKMFLRQDPDFIIVGEIRDHEVAMSAISAAKTGHLTFSTLHTNDVESTISRLYDLGLTKVDIEDGLRGVISQRLIPKLCDNCKKRVQEGDEVFWERNPQGCPECVGGSMPGYSGRIPLTEVALLSGEIENYKRENFLEYLSLEESVLELLEKGIIDKTEASKHITLDRDENLQERKEFLEIWKKVAAGEEDWVYPVFQEIKNRDGLAIGYEVYARVRKENGDVLAPENFFSIVEKTNLLKDFSFHIFKEVVKMAKKHDKFFFFNISKQESIDLVFIESMIEYADANKVRHNIVFEFSFSKEKMDLIEFLEKHDVKYSLHKFTGTIEDIILMERGVVRPDYIKTDEKFMYGMTEGEEWIKNYIEILSASDARLVANYVETESLLEKIKEVSEKIQLFEGYAIANPVKEKDL